jgi:Predicted signal transduction protein with a C-terminal ATPase domain
VKRLLEHITAKYRKFSMKTKLTVSFSVPVIVLFILLFSMIYGDISQNNKAQVLKLADQSVNQAVAYLENTIEYMTYVSNQIYYDGDLQRILSSDDFNGNRKLGVQYREYLVLSNIFSSAEMSDTIFRAGIYIPDELNYSSNGYHFMKESTLLKRSDYKVFEKAAAKDQIFFTISEDAGFPDQKQPLEIVSLLRQVCSSDGGFTPLCVEQVSVKTAYIQSILKNADTTRAGLVYLMNSRGEIVTSCDSEMLERLKQTDSLPDRNARMQWKQWTIDKNKYLVNTQSLPKASWHLVLMLPQKELNQQTQRMNNILLFIAFLIIIVVFVVSYLLAGYYVKRLNYLNRTIHKVQTGDFDVTLIESDGDEISELLNNFTNMANQLKTLMTEKYLSGRAVQAAEMRALQAQINPHFLYNTLDLINWEAYDHGAPEIAEIARNLALFYRISLNKGRNILTIDEELNHTRAYVAIQNFHFTNAIHMTVEVPEEIKKMTCINIILQPFVENAIMHGIGADPSITECNITISAEMDDRDIRIYIKDDGKGMEQELIEWVLSANIDKHAHGYGVKNINSRLKLCYGDEYGVSFKSIPGEGTTVILLIPALTVEEAELRQA